jgi:hypothetical protein
MGTINDYRVLRFHLPLRGIFDLEADQVDLRVADVFDAVRREAIEPSCRGQRIRECPAVEQDVSLAVAADEVTEAEGIVNGGPAVGVDRDRIARWNASVENAHPFIFED